MKNSIKLTAIAAVFGVSGAATASDVLVTPVSNGKQTTIAFELSNTSKAVGLQFNIALPGLDEKQVDTAGCNSGKGVTACHFSKGMLRFATLDTSLAPLPTAQLGAVTIHAPVETLSALQPQAVIVSDAQGNEVPGTLLLDLQFIEGQLNAKQMSEFAVK